MVEPPRRTPLSKVFKIDESSAEPPAAKSDVHAEFSDYQRSIKDLNSSFYAGEDFLKYLEFGKEFDKATQYNSRRKVLDNVGFEYSIPPKEKTLNAKVRTRYNKWLEAERMMEEEEDQALGAFEGMDVPIRLDELKYEMMGDQHDSYDTYYKKIRELEAAEKRYGSKIDAAADSALISGGNVAYGRAVAKSGDDDVEFERKTSVDSLGGIEKMWEVENDTTFKKLANVMKKTIRRKGKKKEADDDERPNDSEHDSDDQSRGGSMRGLKNLYDSAKDRYKSLRR